jgi:hypothetical protein
MRGTPIPELERRRRQLEVINKKLERAELRKDEAGYRSAQIAKQSTEARIHELEEDEPSTAIARRHRKGDD